MDERQLIAGDTWSWTVALDAYPASAGWALTLYAALGAEAPKVAQGTAAGDAFQINVSAADSAGWAPGRYQWSARVSRAGIVVSAQTGALLVSPDPTQAVDRRTHAERCLAAVTAVLEGRTGESIAEYEIDGTKVKHLAHADLLRLRDQFRVEVSLQRRRPVITRIPMGGLLR